MNSANKKERKICTIFINRIGKQVVFTAEKHSIQNTILGNTVMELDLIFTYTINKIYNSYTNNLFHTFVYLSFHIHLLLYVI